jgi:hypothetical protein
MDIFKADLPEGRTFTLVHILSVPDGKLYIYNLETKRGDYIETRASYGDPVEGAEWDMPLSRGTKKRKIASKHKRRASMNEPRRR